ncbi:MAG: hypoxanthine-guanine phosphoribosyltransferase [Gammaproteobacteria bacterium]|nr:hypoxanthine-guanine phosphoribosyltransferase [Gammaproteobacteria bacterium]
MAIAPSIDADQARQLLREAELLYPATAVEAALERMAQAITTRLAGQNPLVMVVMNGGLIPAGLLLTRLDFPLQIGYLHATRYRSGTRGGDLQWLAAPSMEVEDRVVLVIDDIFDEGHTLNAIVAELQRLCARSVHIAVLVNKNHERKAPNLAVDFVGLEVPDRYVFGYGMDCHEYWRNARGIYALNE